jgi:sulfite reductase (NADPH) flavoprotein alpha-component
MLIPVLPASAPFSAEQRAWLNGFFAGIYGVDRSTSGHNGSTSANGFAPTAGDSHSLNRVGGDSGGNTIPAPPTSPAALNGVAPAAPEAEGDAETPWHDPALSLDERMAMAEGKPLPLRLMAAMAQLDCGQCGYLCKTYAQAIADGSEKSLRKCVPGEKPTFLKLKELMAAT